MLRAFSILFLCSSIFFSCTTKNNSRKEPNIILNQEIKKEYWDNGNLASDGIYVNGKANGYMKWYHENGNLAGEGGMINDKRDGLWKVYESEFETLSTEGYFKDGIKHGTWTLFHQNGSIWKEQIWESNQLIHEKKVIKETFTSSSSEKINITTLLNFKLPENNDSIYYYIQTIKNSKNSIHKTLFTQKKIKFTSNKMVTIVPIFDTEKINHEHNFDTYFILSNPENKTILGIYRNQNTGYRTTESTIKNIKIIDDREFKIHKDNFSFGIQIDWESDIKGRQLLILSQYQNELKRVYDQTISETSKTFKEACKYKKNLFNSFATNLTITDTNEYGYYNIEHNITHQYYIWSKNCNAKKITSKGFDIYTWNKELNEYVSKRNSDPKIHFGHSETNEKAIILSESLVAEFNESRPIDTFKNTDNVIVTISHKTNAIQINHKEPCDSFSYVKIAHEPFNCWVNGRNLCSIDTKKAITFHVNDNNYKFTPVVNYSDKHLYHQKMNCSVHTPIVFKNEKTNYEGLVYMENNEFHYPGDFPYFELKNDSNTTDVIQKIEHKDTSLALTVLRTQKKNKILLTVHIYPKHTLKLNTVYYAAITNKKVLTTKETNNKKN